MNGENAMWPGRAFIEGMCSNDTISFSFKQQVQCFSFVNNCAEFQHKLPVGYLGSGNGDWICPSTEVEVQVVQKKMAKDE